MAWPKPKGYSKSKVDWAGEVLSSRVSVKEKNHFKKKQEDQELALDILDNWRAIHRYPMHIFKKRLKRVAEKMHKDAFVAQRLKRLPSIITKLQREYYEQTGKMKLSRMQDIAGCRAVMPTIKLARELYEKEYLQGNIKHKKVNEKDYIKIPKEDGYRSIHLVYRYNSDKPKKQGYNGLLVEIQIRSKLQHLWATAIETVDLFTRQAIKSNEGRQEWKDFFRLVSSAFAIKEETAFVPNTPRNPKNLYKMIKEKEQELQVIKIMTNWAKAVRIFEREFKQKPDLQYFLLELDILGEKLNITGYTADEEQTALEEYARIEKLHQGQKEYDVVLVGVDVAQDLKKAYPNYFADTSEFLKELEKLLKKAE
ncbi:MAG: (p)ppGpp synthetase [Nanoarchaeota archaeon]